MAPRRAPATTPAAIMTPTEIQRVITDRIDAALAERAIANAQPTGNVAPAPRQCTYKDFMACQPTYFMGTEGVTKLAHWFERCETVFQRSGCSESNRVTFATGTLMDDAFSWWTATTQTLGTEAAYQLSWTEFKAKILKKYCPRSEIRKLEDEFHVLAVKGTDLKAYNRRLHELMALCPSIVPTLEKTLEK